jgi:hypothetical protein
MIKSPGSIGWQYSNKYSTPLTILAQKNQEKRKKKGKKPMYLGTINTSPL